MSEVNTPKGNKAAPTAYHEVVSIDIVERAVMIGSRCGRLSVGLVIGRSRFRVSPTALPSILSLASRSRTCASVMYNFTLEEGR